MKEETVVLNFEPIELTEKKRTKINEELIKEFPHIEGLNFMRIDEVNKFILATMIIRGKKENAVFPWNEELIKKINKIIGGK